MTQQATRWSGDPARYGRAQRLIGESVMATYDGGLAPLGYAPRRRRSTTIAVAVVVTIAALVFLGVAQSMFNSSDATMPGSGPPAIFRVAFVIVPLLMIVLNWATVVVSQLDYAEAQRLVDAGSLLETSVPELDAADAKALDAELSSIWGSVVSQAIARRMRYARNGWAGGPPGSNMGL